MAILSSMTDRKNRTETRFSTVAQVGFRNAHRLIEVTQDRTARHSALPSSVIVFAAALLTGCASGIERAEEACANYRTTIAVFANCLRANFATLNSGPQGERDISSIYLAAVEYQAASVAAGRKTDAEAMLELAALNASVLAPEIRRRREAAFQSAMQAMQDSSRRNERSGSNYTAQSGQSSGRGGRSYGSMQPSYSGNSYVRGGAGSWATQPGYYR